MATADIYCVSCSKEFGNPSGHSTAASMISFVLFFDLFYGIPVDVLINTHRSQGNSDNPLSEDFYYANSPCAQCLALFLAIFWCICIPANRVILGQHSIDQVLFGMSLGISNALCCHFFLRDHIMSYIIKVTKQERQYLYTHSLQSIQTGPFNMKFQNRLNSYISARSGNNSIYCLHTPMNGAQTPLNEADYANYRKKSGDDDREDAEDSKLPSN